MKRAIRRHHRGRLRKARKHYHLAALLPVSEKAVAMWISTPQLCSCAGCGNQRRAWGKYQRSMQERRHDWN